MTTPLSQAKYKQKALVTERCANRIAITEHKIRIHSYAVRNAAITEEILALDAVIAAEVRKEEEAKHKTMIDALTAAGYKVVQPVKENLLLFRGRPVVIDPTYFMMPNASVLDNKKLYDDIVKLYGDLQMYDKTTGEPAGTLETALSGGGKAPGMNTPGSGAGSAKPGPKLGGVYGVGEGWYRPIVYINGVKLEHDFAINTSDHHEAGNGWWLKHVPSGTVTKGFPNEAEAHRWIRGRTNRAFNGPTTLVGEWRAGWYPDTK